MDEAAKGRAFSGPCASNLQELHKKKMGRPTLVMMQRIGSSS